ncbi:MAG TPA: hypothetical protein VLF95_04235 [Vicinamibacteria bacterium]|nr:hypothetical protein [Vicinamibacteria bacterium]
MQEEKTVLDRAVDRRQFTLASAMAILAGVAITITDAACGGSSYSPGSPSPTPTPNPNPSPAGDKVGVVSSNHGHSAVITGAQLTAGGALMLDIRGTATHTHSVELSAAEISSIAASQKVAKESSTDASHSHTVTFN